MLEVPYSLIKSWCCPSHMRIPYFSSHTRKAKQKQNLFRQEHFSLELLHSALFNLRSPSATDIALLY